GKRAGATAYHQAFQRHDYQFDAFTGQIVPTLVSRTPVSLGIAIIEDAFDQTAKIEAIRPCDLLAREAELLELASAWMPRLPFDQADLLIVDQIGKEISGTGMDTNVVGRKSNDKAAAADEFPRINQIYVRSLSEASAGNATGIGIAEYCQSSVVESMNVDVTRINCLTSGHVTAAAIPVHYATDAEVLRVAITQAIDPKPSQVRWMWIPDTLHLESVICSEAYYQSATQRSDLQVVDEPSALRFDSADNLVDRS
ncbi:MAG: [Fe-S]-binding protein, partial [Planctomycetota bacterium]